MRTLYHAWLNPFARKVRVALGEKKLEFEAVAVEDGPPSPDLVALNPAGEVPVLIEPDGTVLADSVAITEFLDEIHPMPCLLGENPVRRAEVRRLVAWFDLKFNRDVTIGLVGEKLLKRHGRGRNEPDSKLIRTGFEMIGPHLEYIGWLTEQRRWLAGDDFSLADIAAAAHISAVDYGGGVPWDACPAAKDWYARVKSRPSFRPLLADHLPGAPPPPHYADLDF
jgi:glutathione S-transferase